MRKIDIIFKISAIILLCVCAIELSKINKDINYNAERILLGFEGLWEKLDNIENNQFIQIDELKEK